jgi:hypothetical protein
MLSDGVFMDDDLTHYLIARWGLHEPKFLLDVWGRPGFTIPYAPSSWIGSFEQGFTAARCFTVLVTAATAWLTARVARGLSLPHPWLAALGYVLLPRVFLLSITTLTEPVAALYVIAGVYLLLRRREGWAALVFGLLPLTRHETVVVLPVIGLYLLWRRRYLACLLLPAAMGLWNGLFYLFVERRFEALPIAIFFRPSDLGAQLYGEGSVFHYLARWADVVSPAWIAVVLAGTGLLLAQALVELRRKDPDKVEAMVRLLVALGGVGMVALQTALYLRNRYASGGYARFLVPAAPVMAIAAHATVARFLALARRPLTESDRRWARCLAVWLLTASVGACLAHAYVPYLVLVFTLVPLAGLAIALLIVPGRRLASAVLVLCAVSTVSHTATHVRPQRLRAPELAIREATSAARTRFGPDAELIGYSPWIPYFDGKDRVDYGFSPRERWLQPPGDRPLILVWDSRLAATPQSLPRELVLSVQAERHEHWDLKQEWYEDPFVVIYERTRK